MFFHFHLGIEGLLPWALYIGMFAAFAASVFWQPTAGLYVLVFALPMQTGRYKIHDFFLGSQFIDLLLLGACLGLMVKGKNVFPSAPIGKYLLIYSVFLYLLLWEGPIFASVPLPLWISDARFSDWKNYVELFLLAMVIASTFTSKRQVQLLIITMCLSTLVVNRNYYTLMSARNLAQYSDDVRDAGLLGYAGVNGFAAFEAMFCSFLLGLLVCTKNLLARIGIIFLLVSGLYCLLFSFSRGAYIGLLFGMIAVGFLKSRKFLVVAVLLLCGWQLVLPSSVQQRINMTTGDASSGQHFDSSSEERIALWTDAFELIKRNPLTGTGFQTYQYMNRVGPYRDTHNYYVKVLVETGAVGIVLYLLLLAKLYNTGSSLSSSTEDPFWLSISIAFRASLVCAIAVNLFGDRWTYQQVDGFLWVGLGCVLAGLQATATANSTAIEDGEMAAEMQQECEALPA